MRRPTAFLFALLSACPYALHAQWEVIRVVRGDTIAIDTARISREGPTSPIYEIWERSGQSWDTSLDGTHANVYRASVLREEFDCDRKAMEMLEVIWYRADGSELKRADFSRVTSWGVAAPGSVEEDKINSFCVFLTKPKAKPRKP